MHTEKCMIQSRGTEIPAVFVRPDASTMKVVLMLHGHGGSKDEGNGFAAIADALAERGIASLRMDFPGCGESREPFTANCLTAMKGDVQAAIDWLEAHMTDRIFFGLFGYSMGGRLALECVAEGLRVDALCLLAPATDNRLFADRFAESEEAHVNGYIEYVTKFGQHQQLSAAWFDDLLRYPDANALLSAVHAALGSTPVQVMRGTDDTVVFPDIPEHTAETLGAVLVDVSGRDHSYGFYAPACDAVCQRVVEATVGFFAQIR